MPELPEVETLCRQLNTVLVGSKLRSFEIEDPKIPEIPIKAGSRVCSVRRSGKAVLINFKNASSVIIKLRMTGRLLWTVDPKRFSHSRCIFVFDTGSVHLADPRRFATISILDTAQDKKSIVDPLIVDDSRELMERSAGRRLPIKSFLMDQHTIGGIGNIYACEALHMAAISPWRRACDLDGRQWKRLAKSLKKILEKAIECRGTTVSDWADLFNRPGTYQKHLRVYGREGEPCPRCGAPVIRTLLGGRATFFCTSCQET